MAHPESDLNTDRGVDVTTSLVDRNDCRKELLAEATRARNAGNDRRAITLYRRVLLEDPHNAEVALRAAPLLARRGERFESWQLYRMASQELMRHRQREECLDALREACRWVPEEFEAWRLRSELELKLGRDDRAYETLLEGRQRFRTPPLRAQAIALLTRARLIETDDPDVILDLARLYSRSGQSEAAMELLDTLDPAGSFKTARRRAALQFRITLAPRYAWAWLKTYFMRSAPSKAGTSAIQEAPIFDEEPPAEVHWAEATMPLSGDACLTNPDVESGLTH